MSYNAQQSPTKKNYLAQNISAEGKNPNLDSRSKCYANKLIEEISVIATHIVFYLKIPSHREEHIPQKVMVTVQA